MEEIKREKSYLKLRYVVPSTFFLIQKLLIRLHSDKVVGRAASLFPVFSFLAFLRLLSKSLGRYIQRKKKKPK